MSLAISALEQPADRASSAVERGAGGSGAAQRGEGGGGRENLSPRFSLQYETTKSLAVP